MGCGGSKAQEPKAVEGDDAIEFQKNVAALNASLLADPSQMKTLKAAAGPAAAPSTLLEPTAAKPAGAETPASILANIDEFKSFIAAATVEELSAKVAEFPPELRQTLVKILSEVKAEETVVVKPEAAPAVKAEEKVEVVVPAAAPAKEEAAAPEERIVAPMPGDESPVKEQEVLETPTVPTKGWCCTV